MPAEPKSKAWIPILVALIGSAGVIIASLIEKPAVVIEKPERTEMSTASPLAPSKTATLPAPSVTRDHPPTPEPTQTYTLTPKPTSTHTLKPEPTLTNAPMLKPTSAGTKTPEASPTPTFGPGSPATALRNAYIFPTTNSDTIPLTLVRQGETVTVLGHFYYWLNVRAANGTEGWVYQPGWLEIEGDINALPTVIPPPTPTPTPTTPSACPGGTLTLTLYHIPGSERCLGGVSWSVEIQFIARGGNCVYTYFWEGVQIHGPTTENEYIYNVKWGDAALAGTGSVESGGQVVQHDLFVPQPPCP